MIVSTRPVEGTGSGDQPSRDYYLKLRKLEWTVHVPLHPMESHEINQLVAGSLGVNKIPQSFSDYIAKKSQGNPLFSEQIAFALRDNGMVEIKNRRCRVNPNRMLDEIVLPDSLQGIINNRIDRLNEEQKMTLKVASVIGRRFPLNWVCAVHPVVSEENEIREDLRSLVELNILVETSNDDVMNKDTYEFKQAMTRDVAYQGLLFDHRRIIHRQCAECE